jgi:hypothetical protein
MAKRAGKARGQRQAETKANEPKQKGARTTALVPRERWTPAASPPSPFALMRRFAEEMERLFEDFRLGSSSLLPRFDLPWESREGGGARGCRAWKSPSAVASSSSGPTYPA